MSPGEIQERRKRGLYFNCDESFTPNNWCKKLFFFDGILLNEEEVEDDGEQERLLDSEHEPVILLHAIVGSTSLQTTRIRVVKGHGITVLLDTWSSHNFLITSFADAVGLPHQ